MKRIARRLLLSGGLISITMSGARAQGGGVWIVTAQEATLPQSATSKAGRAISRGPAIRQVSPAGAVAPNKPFQLQVEFAARGGEKIDVKTAQITILRGDNINITQRLKPYITASGIVVADAMVGPGTHVLQVAISDASGRQSLANIEIEAK